MEEEVSLGLRELEGGVIILLIAEDEGRTAECKSRTDKERCRGETIRERAGD